MELQYQVDIVFNYQCWESHLSNACDKVIGETSDRQDYRSGRQASRVINGSESLLIRDKGALEPWSLAGFARSFSRIAQLFSRLRDCAHQPTHHPYL